MKQAFRKHHAPYNSFELTIEIVHIYTTTLTFTLVYTSNTTLLYIQIVFLVYQIICLLYQMCDIIRTLLYIQIVNFVLQMVNISPPPNIQQLLHSFIQHNWHSFMDTICILFTSKCIQFNNNYYTRFRTQSCSTLS
jgi:hypothetical protein